MEDKGSRVGKTNVYSKMQGTSRRRKWHNVLIINACAKFVWLELSFGEERLQVVKLPFSRK